MVTIVTGATRGIGKDIVRYLLSLNYKVAAIGVSAKNCENLEKEFSIPVFQCNVADPDQCKKTVSEIAKIEPVNGLVNCAGIANPKVFIRDPADNMKNIIEINLLGSMFMTREVVSKMMSKKQKGSIVCLSSVLARGTFGLGNAPYAASKGGIDGFVRSMSYELQRMGIRINAIAPCLVETDMGEEVTEDLNQNLKSRSIHDRHVHLEELSYLCEFLLSSKSQYLTGQIIDVDGGIMNVIS